MSVALDYASATSSAHVKPERLVGVVATWVGVIAAGVIVWWSARLASEAHMRLMVPTNCGTGRHEAEIKLYYSMPWFLIVPVTAWIFRGLRGWGRWFAVVRFGPRSLGGECRFFSLRIVMRSGFEPRWC